MSSLLESGWVDPSGGWEIRRARHAMYEAVRPRRIGRRQHAHTIGMDRSPMTVVDRGRRHQPDPGVPMLSVIPGEEGSAERSALPDRVKAVRKARPVLERFEMRLGIRIVAGRIRPGMRLRNAEIREEKRDRLGDHGAPPIGMHGQLALPNLLLLDGLSDELLRQRRRFPRLHRPADHVATEHVEEDIQVVVVHFAGPRSFVISQLQT